MKAGTGGWSPGQSAAQLITQSITEDTALHAFQNVSSPQSLDGKFTQTQKSTNGIQLELLMSIKPPQK